MSNLIRLLTVAALVAFAILAVAVGLARHTAALMGPADLILFLALVAAYVLPSILAVHRNCIATGWIVAVNILLGWTLFGWVVALGWAAAGRTMRVPPSAPAPPVRPVPGH